MPRDEPDLPTLKLAKQASRGSRVPTIFEDSSKLAIRFRHSVIALLDLKHLLVPRPRLSTMCLFGVPVRYFTSAAPDMPVKEVEWGHYFSCMRAFFLVSKESSSSC